MIHIDNVMFLKNFYPDSLKKLQDIERLEIINKYKAVPSKNGQLTLLLNESDMPAFLHSQYDPLNEAERFINKFSDISNYDHIFFYGIGLGYHVKSLLEKFSKHTFSLYEPQPAIMLHWLTHFKLEQYPIRRMKHIFVETSDTDRLSFLSSFANQVDSKVLLVVWPAYERLFKEQYQQFLSEFKERVSDKRAALHINLAFEKRWTINSMLNLKHTLQTPNMLHDVDRAHFKGKPAILVAAGPSLQKEFERLREIKEEGRAYIFSVGSAINALIEQGIMPDAACTYDPTVNNQYVFEKLKARQINAVPLIYGTSVGYETLENYPGPMLHMITTQDTVSPYYLQDESHTTLERVQDAPSIAVVTLELLYKLGCNPVILVGQDLAYPDQQRYAHGIEYRHVSSKLSEEETGNKNFQYVDDVLGNQVLTDQGYTRMRKQLEQYIALFSELKVINTSQRGARIKGAPFMPLADVMDEYLVEKQIVSTDWWKVEPHYCDKVIIARRNKMEQEYAHFLDLKGDIENCLKKIKSDLQKQNVDRMERLFRRLDKSFKRMMRNDFYAVFIRPILRVQAEMLARNASQVRFEPDLIRKGESIYQIFTHYLHHIDQILQGMIPLFNRLHSEMEQAMRQFAVKAVE
jgi:hypothetical protein